MKVNDYKCSDTILTATWKAHSFGSFYFCTNCRHAESYGYPARGIKLGNFCPNCGFKMDNPRFVSIDFDYA